MVREQSSPTTHGAAQASPASRFVPLLVAAAAAALALWRGRIVLAAILLVVALVVTFVPPIGDPVRRGLSVSAHHVSHWLGLLLFGAIDLFLIVPLWAIGRLFRHDALRTRMRRMTGSGFAAVPEAAASTLSVRPYSREVDPAPGGPVRRAARAVPRWLGVILLVLVANYALGLLWDVAWGHDLSGPVGTATGSSPAADPIHVVARPQDPDTIKVVKDERQDLPSMRDKPWWPPYLVELQKTQLSFYPYLLTKPLPYHGNYINVGGWTRKTYAPTPIAGRKPPVVWFFGGSTTWGEGQRDEHTIPSEVSRLAEADGLPIDAVNYGQRGWVNWQEMLLYEMQLADAKEPPAISVFYDGLNDKNVQLQSGLGEPAFYDVDALARTVTGQSVDGGTAARSSAPEPAAASVGDAWDVLWQEYQRHSFVDKVVGKIQDEVGGTAAGAATVPSDAPGESCYRPAKGTAVCRNSSEVAADTLGVYRRGRDLILDLSKGKDVDPVLFWQPERGVESVYAELCKEVGQPTVPLCNTLDQHQDVYIDGGHTNEDGARIVAEAEWKTLKPKVEAWYRAHGGVPG